MSQEKKNNPNLFWKNSGSMWETLWFAAQCLCCSRHLRLWPDKLGLLPINFQKFGRNRKCFCWMLQVKKSKIRQKNKIKFNILYNIFYQLFDILRFYCCWNKLRVFFFSLSLLTLNFVWKSGEEWLRTSETSKIGSFLFQLDLRL